MRTCGSVQSRKGLKSSFGEGSGDGLDIPRGNLLRVELSRGQEEGRTQKVMAKDSAKGVREHWVVVGGGKTDGTKSSPMEVCSGGPMLWSERRGLSQ